MKHAIKTLSLLFLFSTAMGYLESAVVVYLRELYYPGGFGFPLAPMSRQVLLTELLRETATLVMLVSIALLAGKNRLQRFAFFLFCFAVWDIFYYLFLKLLIDWPASLLTWDILFLIPVPWTGPVLAPCLISASMILLALRVIQLQEKYPAARLQIYIPQLLIPGSVVVIIAFTIDYFRFLVERTGDAARSSMPEILSQYLPVKFSWGIFALGEAMILTAIFFADIRTRPGKNRFQKDKKVRA